MTSLSMSDKGRTKIVLQMKRFKLSINLSELLLVLCHGTQPILVLMRKVIPAIVTGCSVALKPSEDNKPPHLSD